MLCEEAHRHGNHGKNAGRQQRGKAEEHAQEENASQPFFFSSVSSFCNRTFFRAVVTESLQRWAVIRPVSRCLAVGKRSLEVQIRWKDALLLIARHERDGAGDDLGSGVGTREGLDEVDLLFEHVDVHFKRRIKLNQGFAFGHLTYGCKPLRPNDAESRRHGPVEAFQMLAVRVPARVHYGVEHQIKRVAVLVNVHIPYNRLKDAVLGSHGFLAVGLIVVPTQVLRLRAVR